MKKILVLFLLFQVLLANNIFANNLGKGIKKIEYKNFKDNVDLYYNVLNHVAKRVNIDKALLFGVIERETRFDLKTFGKSPKGAVGFMGITKICWREMKSDTELKKYTWKDVYENQYINLLFGAKYLKKMINKFNGDIKLALMAFNAGPTHINKLYKKYGSYYKIVNMLKEKALHEKKYKENAFYAEHVLTFKNVYENFICLRA